MSIVPGLGAASQFLVYAHVVHSSGDKERFGKGAVEGVLGPGAANNATLGGSLITTVAFGVPTGLLNAMLLGAFLIQGIPPGPKMLVPEPQGYLTLTYSFVWINVLSNVLTVGICFLVLNQLVKITKIRGHLLIPFVILLVYLGAFAEKNAFEDYILLLIFGVAGWGLQKLDWPRPPLVLGLVLGSLAENRLFLSTQRYGIDWLLRPVVVVILVLILAGAFYPVFRARRQKGRRGSDEFSIQNDLISQKRHLQKVTWKTAFPFFIVIVLAIALWESRNFNFRAGLFPWVAGFITLMLSIVQLAKDFLGWGNNGKMNSHSKREPTLSTDSISRRTAGVFAWLIGYLFGIWLLGFSIAAPICAFMYLRLGVRERWLLSLALAAATFAIFYGFFEGLIHVPFSTGQLFIWLGFD